MNIGICVIWRESRGSGLFLFTNIPSCSFFPARNPLELAVLRLPAMNGRAQLRRPSLKRSGIPACSGASLGPRVLGHDFGELSLSFFSSNLLDILVSLIWIALKISSRVLILKIKKNKILRSNVVKRCGFSWFWLVILCSCCSLGYGECMIGNPFFYLII